MYVVVALAIIVEARTSIQRWADDYPWLLRTQQGVFWAAPLACDQEPLVDELLEGEHHRAALLKAQLPA